jgi:hypothetical protein
MLAILCARSRATPSNRKRTRTNGDYPKFLMGLYDVAGTSRYGAVVTYGDVSGPRGGGWEWAMGCERGRRPGLRPPKQLGAIRAAARTIW